MICRAWFLFVNEFQGPTRCIRLTLLIFIYWTFMSSIRLVTIRTRSSPSCSLMPVTRTEERLLYCSMWSNWASTRFHMLLQLLDLFILITQRLVHSVSRAAMVSLTTDAIRFAKPATTLSSWSASTNASNMSLSLLPRADRSCLPCLPVAIVTRCAGAVRAVLMLRNTLLQVLLDTPLPRAG